LRSAAARFNPTAPTVLLVRRYRPFHEGYKKLNEQGLRRVGQACVAIRDTQGIDDKGPMDLHAIKVPIEMLQGEAVLWRHRRRILVTALPPYPADTMKRQRRELALTLVIRAPYHGTL
jgi:hypothetical protein